MLINPEDPRLAPVSLRRELIAGGESDRTIAKALASGALARPRRGAYTDGPSWRSMTAEQQYAVRSRAAYRQAQTAVFLSHVSALPLLDAPVWGFGLDDVHLTRDDGKAGRREAGIQQHCGRVLEGDCQSAYGVAISSPLRATLEAATVGSVESTLVVANHFLHRGDFTKAELQERFEIAIVGWPFSLRTDLVIRLSDPRIESVGETRTLCFLWRRHFPRPVPQFEVRDADELVALLDFALPDQKVWIEFDGKVKYQRHLRPGEDVTAAVLREKRREERIMELTGWRPFRITWWDLEHPDQLAARLQRLIEASAGAA
ncbi:hypothetical protein F0U44_21805 [Nocardioides humilatus]|uniref:Transcriptional regulator, AbiEi antitoxin, Type IV TA system n=1 Tax=Nocardioides humilatus TaxID=2607660 RepID=A0A5B1L496_9ACTN|nr:hypothetical protein [Nocardioides humilatus]KAA1415325.1 hypothetical protein F0U44_21805 [Nocardioides humilatus]